MCGPLGVADNHLCRFRSLLSHPIPHFFNFSIELNFVDGLGNII